MKIIYGKDQAVPVKYWDADGRVPFAENTFEQAKKVSTLPFIHKHVALMPDAHLGKGATIGSVIPTKKAIIPAAVGVDLGCGMMALHTSLTANDLPDSLGYVRAAIEKAIPHGRSARGGAGDQGAWGNIPNFIAVAWRNLMADDFAIIVDKHPAIAKSNNAVHLGTLGTGNHFVEVCLDLNDHVWIMLHSGSRGVGNRIGSYFIQKAKEDMRKYFINLPDQDLAYLAEGTENFDDYWKAVSWAQDYALLSRQIMMENAQRALEATVRPFEVVEQAVNCHHNYVAVENHYGENVYVTRKGAIRARKGDLGIIPGSMGAQSFIVRGKGNPESFHSCSHGAGRTMSRTEAKKTITLEQHKADLEGVECRNDETTLDESPKAYKPIKYVMEAQQEMVEVVVELHQVVCVKG